MIDKKAFAWGDPLPGGPSGIQDTPPPGHTSPYEFDFPYGGQSPDRTDNSSADEDLKKDFRKVPAGGHMVDELEGLKSRIQKMLNRKRHMAAAADHGGEEMHNIDKALKDKILSKIAGFRDTLPPSGEEVEIQVTAKDRINIKKIFKALQSIFLERHDTGLAKDEKVPYEVSGIRAMITNTAAQEDLYAYKGLVLEPLDGGKRLTPKQAFERYHKIIVDAVIEAPIEDKSGPLAIISSAADLADSWAAPSREAVEGDVSAEEKHGTPVAKTVKVDAKRAAALRERLREWNELSKAVEAAEQQMKMFNIPLTAIGRARGVYRQTFQEILKIPANIHVAAMSWYRGVIDKVNNIMTPKLMVNYNGLETGWKAIDSHLQIASLYKGEDTKTETFLVTPPRKRDPNATGEEPQGGRISLRPSAPPPAPIRATWEQVEKILNEVAEQNGVPLLSPAVTKLLKNKFEHIAHDSMVAAMRTEVDAKKVKEKIYGVVSVEDKTKKLVAEMSDKIKQAVATGDMDAAQEARIQKMVDRGNSIGDMESLAQALKAQLGDPAFAAMTGKTPKKIPTDFFGRVRETSFESGMSRIADGEWSSLAGQFDAIAREIRESRDEFEAAYAAACQNILQASSVLLTQTEDMVDLVTSGGEEPEEEEGKGWLSDVREKATEWAKENIVEPAQSMGQTLQPGLAGAAASADSGLERKAAEEKKEAKPHLHTEDVPISTWQALKQFTVGLWKQGDSEYTGPMTELMNVDPDKRMTGLQFFEAIYNSGRAAITNLLVSTNALIPKQCDTIARQIEEGKVMMGLPHDELMEEFVNEGMGPYARKAEKMIEVVRVLNKRLAAEASVIRGKLDEPGMVQMTSGTGRSHYDISENPMEGLPKGEKIDHNNINITALADSLMKLAKKDHETKALDAQMGQALAIVDHILRQRRAELIKKANDGKEEAMSDEDRKKLYDLQYVPTRIQMSTPGQTTFRLEDAQKIVNTLESLNKDLEEEVKRGMNQFTSADGARLQELWNKRDQVAISGKALTDQELEEMRTLEVKYQAKMHDQFGNAPAPAEFRDYKLSPEHIKKKSTRYRVLIDEFKKLVDLHKKVQEFEESRKVPGQEQYGAGEMAMTYADMKDKLQKIDDIVREAEGDPDFQEAARLMHVRNNPVLKEIWESLNQGEQEDWDEIVRERGINLKRKVQPGKKKSKSSIDYSGVLFGGAPLRVSAAETDSEFDAAISEVYRIASEMEGLVGISEDIALLDTAIANPKIVNRSASAETGLARKADRIAGADMYKEYDLSPNAWAIVDAVDGAKKLTIDRKIRETVKDKLSGVKSAFSAGESVAVDFDDAIQNGKVVAHLGGTNYSVSVSGKVWEVDGSRIFRI